MSPTNAAIYNADIVNPQTDIERSTSNMKLTQKNQETGGNRQLHGFIIRAFQQNQFPGTMPFVPWGVMVEGARIKRAIALRLISVISYL